MRLFARPEESFSVTYFLFPKNLHFILKEIRYWMTLLNYVVDLFNIQLVGIKQK